MMAGGGGGEAAAPGRDWESSSPPAMNGEAGVSGHHHPPRHVVSDEMLYKLSKKIAQLTKVRDFAHGLLKGPEDLKGQCHEIFDFWFFS
jgi:hypothetical protein